MRGVTYFILFIVALSINQSCNKSPDTDTTPTNPTNPLTPTAPVTPTSPVNVDSVVAVYIADPYHLFAFDGRTGVKKWAFEFSELVGFSTPPAYLDGYIFQPTDNNKLYAIDSSGNRKWIFQPVGRNMSRPAVGQAIVYIMNLNLNGDEILYALDAKNGQIKWQSKVENSSPYDYPIVKNDLVFTSSGGLTAFDALTGVKKWYYPITTYNHVVTDDKIYTLEGSTVRILDAKTGNLRRTVSGLSGGVSMNVGNGFVYLLQESSAIYKIIALDTTGFLQKWAAVNGTISSLTEIGNYPHIADSILIYEAIPGIYAYNAFTGAKVWETVGEGRKGGTIVNNTIYYGSLKRGFVDSVKLHAYDLNTKSFKWSFTMKGEAFHGEPCVVTKSGKMYRIGD
jgi:outer membrane protein assembly factor BamB